MATDSSRSICAVIVTFHPNLGTLEAVLRAAAPQVSEIVIVDNSIASDGVASLLRDHEFGRCELIRKGSNVGLAAAQNEGIDRALRRGADYILLLDHDSVPAPDMVKHLVNALESSGGTGGRYAAAGPVFTDARSYSESYFVQFGAFRLKRIRCGDAPTRTIVADFLISSGMMIAAPVFRDVGTMDEGLFIDHVDTEWCLRARSKGYRMLGVCAARMSHRLGDGPARQIGGRNFFVHSAARHYFIFRNSLLLYRRSYPALRWKLADVPRLLMLFGAIVMFCPPRWTHVKAVLKGLVDGLRGRSGPLPEGIYPHQ